VLSLPLSIGPPLDIIHLSTTMDQGTIARLTDRGFGFIKRDGQEKDLFFHSKELVGITFEELREGDKVTFEVAESPKGPNAIKVSKI
jgi:cold shock protein